jgi:hypothetical protein
VYIFDLYWNVSWKQRKKNQLLLLSMSWTNWLHNLLNPIISITYSKIARNLCLMTAILAIQEVVIRRIAVQKPAQENSSQDPILKNPSQK